MKVILFGGTGMVGQGVLRECLLDPGVTSVLSIARSQTGSEDPKLSVAVHSNFLDFSALEPQLSGFDACFFCLGVTSAGMTEQDYTRVTYGYTLAAAETLARLNPQMTFVYVSAIGADSSERGRMMWARVRGKTENALLRLPFKAVYVFRPAGIAPLHGERSRTWLTRFSYAIIGPLFPLLQHTFPRYITTTEKLGRAMLKVARTGAPKRVIESADINTI
jgi:uncharacterized protein YbjT (DUF2867 family)